MKDRQNSLNSPGILKSRDKRGDRQANGVNCAGVWQFGAKSAATGSTSRETFMTCVVGGDPVFGLRWITVITCSIRTARRDAEEKTCLLGHTSIAAVWGDAVM